MHADIRPWRLLVSLTGLVLMGSMALVPSAGAQVALGYGMDETSGTTMVGSGGAPNGKISGDVTLGVPGVSGTGYAFNQNVHSCSNSNTVVTGTGSVTIPASSVFNVGTQPFSFSVWLQTTAVPGADSGKTADCDFDVWRRAGRWKLELVPKANNTYGGPKCAWTGVLNGNATRVALSAGVNVTDGRWHHVTCSRTSSGEQLIVDGSVKASSSVNVGTISTNATIFVATQQAGVDYYEGRLDDLSFSVG
jgi:hypothetical protein